VNFSDEEYVRLYTSDTVTWKCLGWQGQALLSLALRKFDRAGVLEFGRHGPEKALMVATGVPLEVVAAGLSALLSEQVWVIDGDRIFWPKYIDAQTCTRSQRVRQRASRARRQGQSEPPECDNASQNVTTGHENAPAVTDVTECHPRRGEARQGSDPSLVSSSNLVGEISDAREPEPGPPPAPPPPARLPTRRERATADLMTCPAAELAAHVRANPHDASISPLADRPDVAAINAGWSKAVGLVIRPLGCYSERNKPLQAILDALAVAPIEDVLRACEQAGRDDWCTGRKGSERDQARKRDVGCLSPTVLRRLLDTVDESAAKDRKRKANADKLAAAERSERERESGPRAPPPAVKRVRELVSGVIAKPPASLPRALARPMSAEEIDAALASGGST
jgi:hypothetical protein